MQDVNFALRWDETVTMCRILILCKCESAYSFLEVLVQSNERAQFYQLSSPQRQSSCIKFWERTIVFIPFTTYSFLIIFILYLINQICIILWFILLSLIKCHSLTHCTELSVNFVMHFVIITKANWDLTFHQLLHARIALVRNSPFEKREYRIIRGFGDWGEIVKITRFIARIFYISYIIR